MKNEHKMDLLIAARDIYIQCDRVVCKEKKSNQIKSFSVNQHVWLLTPFSYVRQDRQALVHCMPLSFLTF